MKRSYATPLIGIDDIADHGFIYDHTIGMNKIHRYSIDNKENISHYSTC